MNPEREIAEAMKKVVVAGKQNGAERAYANACERQRLAHNAAGNGPHRMRIKKKYRG